MDADVNTHVSLALPLSLPPSLSLSRPVLMQRTCATGKLLHIKSVSHGTTSQARPSQPAACTVESNRRQFLFICQGVETYVPHGQVKEQQPCPARPCSVHKCRRKYICQGEQQPGEFSVFCAFLKWANLCDTLRQLIKLNKHEAGPEEKNVPYRTKTANCRNGKRAALKN